MKNLSKSEKFLISVLLVMLVGYVYYQYIFTPVSTKLQTAKNNVEQYEQELLQSKLMAASNKKMTEDLNGLKADYEKYIKLMPKSDMSAEIIREVNNVAVNSKVTLNSLTLGEGVEYKLPGAAERTNSAGNNSAANNAQVTQAQASEAKVMAVPISINVAGDYNSFIAFIKSLENGSRITNISSVNVAKEKDNAGDNKLAVTLNASILYVQDGTVENVYDFNNGNYSKVDPFK